LCQCCICPCCLRSVCKMADEIARPDPKEFVVLVFHGNGTECLDTHCYPSA
jgi:hypothetical protein